MDKGVNMNSIHELVYDYLKQQDGPITSKQILDNVLPGFLKSGTLQVILKELQKKKRVTKKKVGKDNLFSVVQDEKADNFNKEKLNLSFNYGIRLDNPSFLVHIPDGYKINNPRGTNFTAWLPNPKNPNDLSSAIVRISPCTPPEMRDCAGKVTKIDLAKIIDLFSTKSYEDSYNEVHEVNIVNTPLCGCAYLCYSDYWCGIVNLYTDKNIISFRMEMKELSRCDRQLAEKIFFDWINTIEIKNPPETNKELDDPSFMDMKLTESGVKKYCDEISDYKAHLEALKTICLKDLITIYTGKEVDASKLLLEFNNLLYDFAVIKSMVYKKIIKTVNYVIDKNPENPLIVDLCAMCYAQIEEKERLLGNGDEIFLDIPDVCYIKDSLKKENLKKFSTDFDERVEFYKNHIESKYKIRFIKEMKDYIKERREFYKGLDKQFDEVENNISSCINSTSAGLREICNQNIPFPLEERLYRELTNNLMDLLCGLYDVVFETFNYAAASKTVRKLALASIVNSYERWVTKYYCNIVIRCGSHLEYTRKITDNYKGKQVVENLEKMKKDLKKYKELSFDYDEKLKTAKDRVADRIKSLEKQIENYDEDVKKLEKNLEVTQKQYEKVKKEYDNLNNGNVGQKAADNSDSKLESVIEKLKENSKNVEAAKKEINDNNITIENLGFFSSGRKKELKNRNMELEGKILDYSKEIDEYNDSLLTLYSDRLKVLQEVDQKLDETSLKFENAADELNKAEAKLNESKEKNLDYLNRQLSEINVLYKNFNDEYIYHQFHLKDLKQVFDNFGISGRGVDFEYKIQ